MPTPLDMFNKLTGPQDPPEDPQDPPEDPQDPPEDPQDPPEDPQDPPEDPQDPPEDPQGDTFPRSYVEQLRKESANYRKQAESSSTAAEALRNDLHLALVELDGRLAVPSDLPPLEGDNSLDRSAIAAAIDKLLEARPRLAARALGGDIGQGSRGKRGVQVDLIQLMRNA